MVKGQYVENLLDNYIKDNIKEQGTIAGVNAGDTVDIDVYRMLTFLGDKGNKLLWSMYNEETKTYSKLSQEAADAINNFKGDK
jgi:ferritin-like metal-binding protein YciE